MPLLFVIFGKIIPIIFRELAFRMIIIPAFFSQNKIVVVLTSFT